ncbi:UDP-N-acetylmuramate dehydrogenase [Flavihumibacter sp. UBA7668]|uniref:UDP-N-acetylmuramate dehydrogenase n=1 Tax=Flavihumibacter sp. UBA7668 TaxID=1946542 RepID=UPI0025BC7A65|nr:UDP-N-acetylmuramate dehydrogenase [Flavihumibacter sp. UBA7668]
MKIYSDFDLTNYNSYRINSVCKRAIFFDSENEIVEYFSKTSLDNCVVLGNGNNVILTKNRYENDFIIFNGNYNSYAFCANESQLRAEAGMLLSDLSLLALKHSLTGLEVFYDIPSSLGGAVVMNAGASGEEIKDVLSFVRFLDLETNKVREFSKSEISFEYRNSYFQKNKNNIVLSAKIDLIPGDRGSIETKMNLIRDQRWLKQPREFPNAGSVFKRPPGYFVGAIIDNLNLKGLVVGGAKISEKHGGFIINFNKASGSDIVKIIDHVRELVLREFGVELEIEQRLI